MEDTLTGDKIATVIGIVGYNCPLINGQTTAYNHAKFDDLYPGFSVSGVFVDRDLHTPYNFEQKLMTVNPPAYIGWERNCKLLPIVGERCAIEIGYLCPAMSDFHKGVLVSENDMQGIYYCPGLSMNRLPIIMAEYDGRTEAESAMYVPNIFLSYEIGYQLPDQKGFMVTSETGYEITAVDKFYDLYEDDTWNMIKDGYKVVVRHEETDFTFDEIFLRYKSAAKQTKLNFSTNLPKFSLHDVIGLSGRKENGFEFYWSLYVSAVSGGTPDVYPLDVPTVTKLGGISTNGFEYIDASLTSADEAAFGATTGYPISRRFDNVIPASGVIVDGSMTMYVNYYEGIEF